MRRLDPIFVRLGPFSIVSSISLALIPLLAPLLYIRKLMGRKQIGTHVQTLCRVDIPEKFF